jgi:hypothetical protein
MLFNWLLVRKALNGSKLADTPWQENPINPSMFFDDQISRMMDKAAHSLILTINIFFFSS